MGEVNLSGSGLALRRALFPQDFNKEVMHHVLETWQSFSRKQQARLENRITALFRDALIDAYLKAGRNWFVTLEDPITDPDFGTELGRNDLRFYPPDHFGQTIFFTLECKRLRVRTQSGFKHLADEYAEKGLQRFVEDNHYSAGLPCGGMLGYVMDGRLDEACESVKSEIDKRKQDLKMKRKKPVSPSSVLPHHQHSMDTIHFRTDGEIIIHHLLVSLNT